MQTASPRRETSRTCAGRRSAASDPPGVLTRSSPTVSREDHPRGAGQDDPTAESPAAGGRPGQRINDDGVGAIDLGHEPGFEPPPECVGTAVG